MPETRLSRLLREKQRERGYATDEEFGAAVGVQQGAATKWFNGDTIPGDQTLPDIARVIDMPVDELLPYVHEARRDRAGTSKGPKAANERRRAEKQKIVLELRRALKRAGLDQDRVTRLGDHTASGSRMPDVVARRGDEVIVIEVKSHLSAKNEREELGAALGEALYYAKVIEADGGRSLPVVVVPREPRDPIWSTLFAEAGVDLVAGDASQVVKVLTAPHHGRRLRAVDRIDLGERIERVEVLPAAAEQADAAAQKVKPARRPSRVREEPEG